MLRVGDLVQVWAPGTQSRLHGHTAIVLSTERQRAGESEYIQVLCDGPRMMPAHWLREIP